MGYVTNSMFLALHTARKADISFGKQQGQEKLYRQISGAGDLAMQNSLGGDRFGNNNSGDTFESAKQTELDLARLNVQDSAVSAQYDNTKKMLKEDFDREKNSPF